MELPIKISRTQKRFALAAAGHMLFVLVLFAKPVLGQEDGNTTSGTAPELDAVEAEVEAWRQIFIRLAQLALGMYLVYYLFGMVAGDRAGNLKSTVLVIGIIIVLELFNELFGSLGL